MYAVSDQTSRREQDGDTDAIGSYGRGTYARHSTFGCDYCHQESYGCRTAAGLAPDERDDDAPGSYGRGIYAGHSTEQLDFRRQGSYARGMHIST